MQDYIKQQKSEVNDSSKDDNNDGDDEFNDFVSVQTSVNEKPASNVESVNLNMDKNVFATTNLQQNQLNEINSSSQNTNSSGEIKMKQMNLPEVGCSPLSSPTNSFDKPKDDDDDEFDDFQSATSLPSLDTLKTPSFSTPSANLTTTNNTLGNSENLILESKNNNINQTSSDDKYDVFRQLESNYEAKVSISSNNQDLDDSFGDFCSSRPTDIKPPPVFQPSGPMAGSSIDETFVADFSNFPNVEPAISEKVKSCNSDLVKNTTEDWADSFGEFTEAPPKLDTTNSLKINSLSSQQTSSVDDDDDDFGDFMGPAGTSNNTNIPPNNYIVGLTEGLGETQSVASLELPSLDVTVGAEGRSTSSNQSPDSFVTAKSDFQAVEDQFSNLTVDSSSRISPTEITPVNVTALKTTPSIDSYSSSGLADRYSSIREAANKTCLDEAHTGSWQRCLESSVSLLSAGANTLCSIRDNQTLLDEVLGTSQMHNYLLNLQEVWGVCKRIQESSRRVTTSSRVDELLALAHTHWAQILTYAEHTLEKDSPRHIKPNVTQSSDVVCGVCLRGGNVSLSYGGYSYHAPCANLWLNCVDLTLPSLTPVTLL